MTVILPATCQNAGFPDLTLILQSGERVKWLLSKEIKRENDIKIEFKCWVHTGVLNPEPGHLVAALMK